MSRGRMQPHVYLPVAINNWKVHTHNKYTICTYFTAPPKNGYHEHRHIDLSRGLMRMCRILACCDYGVGVVLAALLVVHAVRA